MPPDNPAELQQLAQFQQQFLDRLYFQQPLTAVTVNRAACGADAQQCLDTYRGSLYGGLNQALAEIYPVCRQFVGEAFFSAMADRYISRYPSTVERLDDYGLEFAEFLACFEPVHTLPQLPTLARLEWAWHRAFHAADVAPFDFNAFAQACQHSSGGIQFQLAPELTLLMADYPVDLLWQWHQPGEAGEMPELVAVELPLVIFRPGAQVHIERLDKTAWQFLQQLQRDRSLNGLCEVMGDQVTPLLPLAIERGWVSGFTLA